MVSVDDVIGEVRRELAAAYAARLRERLLQQPAEWLVDELIARLDADAPGRPVSGDSPAARAPASASTSTSAAAAVRAAHPRPTREGDGEGEDPRIARARRIRAMELDEAGVRAFIERGQLFTRERLERDGYLSDPPCKGSALIGTSGRTPAGEALLRDAKDLLDALLFGDAAAGVRLARVQRELLTITLASAKAEAVACLLRAATEIDAEGTWRDPARLADDCRAPNTVLEVEYGEVASEIVGRGIAVALRLINDLEINEQVLYARMENVEESSLEARS